MTDCRDDDDAPSGWNVHRNESTAMELEACQFHFLGMKTTTKSDDDDSRSSWQCLSKDGGGYGGGGEIGDNGQILYPRLGHHDDHGSSLWIAIGSVVGLNNIPLVLSWLFDSVCEVEFMKRGRNSSQLTPKYSL